MSHGLPLGQVLADEPIGVLVEAAFPRMVRLGEVEDYAGRPLDLLVRVELGTVVRRHRKHTVFLSSDELYGPFPDLLLGAILELADGNQASLAFDHREHAVFVSGTHDGVHFPVSDFGALLDGIRPFRNVLLAG